MKQHGFTLTNISMLVLVQLLMVSTFTAMAQDGNFGSDPDKCKENISLYREYYKQDNYADAIMGWRWAFANCPAASKNIIYNGPKIIEFQIEKHQSDSIILQGYVDTLLMVFDKRIELFGSDSTSKLGTNLLDEAYSLGEKGLAIYKYRPDDLGSAFDLLKKSVSLGGNSSDFNVLMTYYFVARKLVLKEKLDLEEVYSIYDEISKVFEYKLAISGYKYAKYYEQAQSNVDADFAKIATQEKYIELMKPKVDAAPEDAALLEKVTTMMVKRDWLNSEFYLDASEKLYKLKPSTVAAYNLYEGHAKKGNNEDAIRFLEESIASDKDNNSKADKLLKLAKQYWADKKASSARSKAQEAASLKSGWGEPYLYIGDLYLNTSSSCGEDACTKAYGYWAATDMYLRAKSADGSIAAEVDKKLATVKKYYPTAKDCFFLGVQTGQSVTVGGWIGVETTARFAD
jgi:tetratricopeptide (TPR) repeat protein